MNEQDVLGAFLLVNNPIVLSEEETKDVQKAIKKLQQENQELKKQVEEYKKQVDKGLYNTCLPYTTGYNKAIEDKETQQKEFIKYLEDEIKFYKNRDTYIVADILGSYDLNDIELKLLEEILSKYKEIIGDDK